VHPDDLPGLRAATREAIDEGTGYEQQFRVRFVDGRYRSMMGRARIRRHPQTGVAHLSGSAVDISDRVQAEASTREVRDRFDAFMRHSPAAAYIKDAEGRYVYANQIVASMLKSTPEKMIGKTDLELLPSRIADLYRANDMRVLQSGRTSEFHETLPGTEGEEGDRDFLTFKFMLRDAHDQPLIGGMSLDITQRVRTERELRGSEARFHKMADSIPQLAWTARPDGTIEWFNRRWLDYTGVTLTQFATNGWQLVVEPALLASMTQALRVGFDSASEIEMRFGLRAADGAHRPFLMKVLPLSDEAGNVLQWFGTHTDISTQVALEAQRREEDQRKDAFLATLAHELRNPLAPLRNGLEVLRRSGTPDSPIARTHAMMDRQLNHVSRLLDDLLDIARVRHGKLELHRQQVTLAQALDLAIEMTESFLVNAGQTLKLEPLNRGIEVDADLFRLAQVFSNLLNNAAKFSHRGSSISVSMARDGFQVEVAIRDEGVGFTPDELPFLFDMFWQASGDGPNLRRGLGIGLSLVRNIIELHGGTVTAESRGEGHGSTFRVRLPLAVPRLAGVPARQSVEGPAQGIRVLIADDNEDAVESLAQLLRLDGHEVLVAHDGEQALELAERELPQAAILDIGMPQLDGYE
ncbi:MAG: PAS domain-containing protein, partial [Panacagrimonas sp.]